MKKGKQIELQLLERDKTKTSRESTTSNDMLNRDESEAVRSGQRSNFKSFNSNDTMQSDRASTVRKR